MELLLLDQVGRAVGGRRGAARRSAGPVDVGHDRRRRWTFDAGSEKIFDGEDGRFAADGVDGLVFAHLVDAGSRCGRHLLRQ